MNKRMPCRITDGPQTPEDQEREFEYFDPDEDPSPWCQWCMAATEETCDCGPIAENH